MFAAFAAGFRAGSGSAFGGVGERRTTRLLLRDSRLLKGETPAPLGEAAPSSRCRSLSSVLASSTVLVAAEGKAMVVWITECKRALGGT